MTAEGFVTWAELYYGVKYREIVRAAVLHYLKTRIHPVHYVRLRELVELSHSGAFKTVPDVAVLESCRKVLREELTAHYPQLELLSDGVPADREEAICALRRIIAMLLEKDEGAKKAKREGKDADRTARNY